MEEKYGHQPPHYSESFKLMVVKEIISGKISQTAAQYKYGIGGNSTIKRWIAKFHKLGSQRKQEETFMSKAEQELEKLKKEKQQLESALAQAHIKILTLESTVEILEEKSAEKLKKKREAPSYPGVYINRANKEQK